MISELRSSEAKRHAESAVDKRRWAGMLGLRRVCSSRPVMYAGNHSDDRVVVCFECGSEKSEPPNRILPCKLCGITWHPLCDPDGGCDSTGSSSGSDDDDENKIDRQHSNGWYCSSHKRTRENIVASDRECEEGPVGEVEESFATDDVIEWSQDGPIVGDGRYVTLKLDEKGAAGGSTSESESDSDGVAEKESEVKDMETDVKRMPTIKQKKQTGSSTMVKVLKRSSDGQTFEQHSVNQTTGLDVVDSMCERTSEQRIMTIVDKTVTVDGDAMLVEKVHKSVNGEQGTGSSVVVDEYNDNSMNVSVSMSGEEVGTISTLLAKRTEVESPAVPLPNTTNIQRAIRYFAESHDISVEDAAYHLYRHSFNFNMASVYLKTGRTHEQVLWTHQDDELLRSDDVNDMVALLYRKGLKSINVRRSFLGIGDTNVDTSSDDSDWVKTSESIRITTTSLPSQWAHAVNTRGLLQAALKKPSVVYIEADVGYGTWRDSSEQPASPITPGIVQTNAATSKLKDLILCHPPVVVSDLRLIDVLDSVLAQPQVQVLKLDFKDPSAVKPSMQLLERGFDVSNRGTQKKPQLWLNADIFQGPGGIEAVVSPDRFCDETLAFPNSILSLGWTTGHTNPLQLGYTSAMIDDMLVFCARPELKGRQITFAVHCIHALNSAPSMDRLLAASPLYTITFWGEADMHFVDWVRGAFPPERSLLDKKVALDHPQP
eukprot:CFRG1070T1